MLQWRRIKYLFENGFYVDDKKNEVLELENEINKNIANNFDSLELTIALTNQCNFNCIYCYQEKNKKVMSQNTADTILDKIEEIIKKISYKKICIHYFGGEPLLNIPILKYIDKKINNLCSKNHLLYISYITTNGSMIGTELLHTVHFDYIQLTFEGRENIHNQLRKSDKFHYCDEIKLLKKIIEETKATIILRMNACIQNKEEIVVFYKYILENYEYERIEINPNRMIKYHEKDKFDMLTQKEFSEIIFNMKLLLEDITGKFNLPSAIKNPCNFVSDSAFSISPDGLCNFCSGLVENGDNFFHDWDVTERRKIKFRVECRNCSYLPLCLGGCAVQQKLGVGCCTYEKYFMKEILTHFIDLGTNKALSE